MRLKLAKSASREVQSLSNEAMLIAYFLRVRAAFFAEREREAAERLAAALRAWRDSAFLDAALRPSRLSALEVARERLADFFPLEALIPS